MENDWDYRKEIAEKAGLTFFIDRQGFWVECRIRGLPNHAYSLTREPSKDELEKWNDIFSKIEEN